MWCKLTTNVDLTIKNEYQIQLQFDTHLGLHFHFLYSKTELLTTNLVPFLTIEQQFKLLSKYKKDTLSEDAYQKLVKQLNLSDITNQLPNQISGGQKQRVAIAKAIYTNPSIILADEPTASLDTNNAMAVMKILQKQTKERNKTCVIVTHDERLTHFCDKTYFMEDGVLSLQ